ncbi:MAG TPA: acyltransferase [Thermoleophilaceae bacterium]|nr:acyltransferase [Thermoleophilaceae bacterium]
MNVRAERFPLMDSLRAIAALSVLTFHAGYFAGMYTSGSVLRPYVAQAASGISVFFVISGFLLYRPFVKARLEGLPMPAVGAYAWRRFLRIVPAYWLALTVIALWLSLEIVVDPAWHVPLFYGFGQIYTADTALGGLGPAWTLCVEVTFYAFLPLWALAMRGRGFRAELAALAGLWLASLVWKLLATRHVEPSSLDSGPWLMPLPNFLDQFAAGMALALVSVRGLPASLERATRHAWPWWVAAALAYWLLSTRIGLHGRLGEDVTPREFMLRHELELVVAVGLIVPAIFAFGRAGPVRRVLAWRPLLYLGLVSYGIYLWHEALVRKIATGTSDWMTDTLGLGVEARFAVLFGLTLAAATAVASASYYAVERPALSLKRLVGPPPERDEPGEALAEPAPAEPPAASTIART